MNRIKNYKKIIIFVSILIAIFLIIFTTKKIIKSQKSKNNKAVATYTEAVEEPEKEDIIVSTENTNENIDENINPEDTSWDEEAEETKVDEKEEQKAKENSTNTYYIKINYTANVVTIYKKDNDGNYTIPVKALVCSTGVATPTSGVYKMSNKYRWHMLNGGVYGQYCTRITGHILFHSVPYATNSPDSLKYVAYDKLGTRASAGCIRLTVEDAMWVYNNCASGTYVEFYSSSNPGPLGKPSAKKISSNVSCRNWDPTDPDNRNPWHSYVEPKNTEEIEKVQQPKIEEKKENTEKQNEISNKPVEENKINTNTNSISNTNTDTSNTNTSTLNTNANQTTNNESTKEKTNTTSENNSKTNNKETSNQISNKTKDQEVTKSIEKEQNN